MVFEFQLSRLFCRNSGSAFKRTTHPPSHLRRFDLWSRRLSASLALSPGSSILVFDRDIWDYCCVVTTAMLAHKAHTPLVFLCWRGSRFFHSREARRIAGQFVVWDGQAVMGRRGTLWKVAHESFRDKLER